MFTTIYQKVLFSGIDLGLIFVVLSATSFPLWVWRDISYPTVLGGEIWGPGGGHGRWDMGGGTPGVGHGRGTWAVGTQGPGDMGGGGTRWGHGGGGDPGGEKGAPGDMGPLGGWGAAPGTCPGGPGGNARGDMPGGDMPGGDMPGGDMPGGDMPGGDMPGGDMPGGDMPGGDMPGGDMPGGRHAGCRDDSAMDATNQAMGQFESGGGFEDMGQDAVFDMANDMDTQGFQDLGGEGTLDMIETMGDSFFEMEGDQMAGAFSAMDHNDMEALGGDQLFEAAGNMGKILTSRPWAGIVHLRCSIPWVVMQRR
ncbi:MAG: hypothetical protein CM1200mP22_16320 [Dehalococcoidia bacterium]|nr:MAG: hypothetical protein CM1200mP22_16320 [Dehalococcoidia bacterium]